MKINEYIFKVIIEKEDINNYWWRAFSLGDTKERIIFEQSEYYEPYTSVEEAVEAWDNFANENDIKNYKVGCWKTKKKKKHCVIKTMGTIPIGCCID